MNKKELLRVIKKYGWNIETYDIDFRLQDSILNYNKNVMLKLTKDENVIYLFVTGQIRIYGKRGGTEFVYKGGGNARGELTSYLRKHGNWENNNWFEVFDSEDWQTSGDVYYYLDDALDVVIELMEREI